MWEDCVCRVDSRFSHSDPVDEVCEHVDRCVAYPHYYPHTTHTLSTEALLYGCVQSLLDCFKIHT